MASQETVICEMADQNLEETLSGPIGSAGFPTTHWSVVLQAGATLDSQVHGALESLCRKYWYPLYHFTRRQGRDHHQAEDCVQEYLAQLLSVDGLQRARPERGRFRTFLLSGLRTFMTSEWRRTQAEKRGGGKSIISLAISDAGERFCPEPRDTALTPEQSFDRTWALGLIDQAVAEVRVEYQRGGRELVFDALAPLVWGGDQSALLELAARRMQMTVPALTVALHRARRRLGEKLRALVAETVADPAEIDAELRHLVSAIIETGAPR